jgi:hypothetical protein
VNGSLRRQPEGLSRLPDEEAAQIIALLDGLIVNLDCLGHAGTAAQDA